MSRCCVYIKQMVEFMSRRRVQIKQDNTRLAASNNGRACRWWSCRLFLWTTTCWNESIQQFASASTKVLQPCFSPRVGSLSPERRNPFHVIPLPVYRAMRGNEQAEVGNGGVTLNRRPAVHTGIQTPRPFTWQEYKTDVHIWSFKMRPSKNIAQTKSGIRAYNRQRRVRAGS